MDTTIVRHKTTRGLYAVVGTGFAAWAHARDSWLSRSDGGKDCIVIACDRKGTLGAFKMDELEVMPVAGVTPNEAIADALQRFGDPAPATEE